MTRAAVVGRAVELLQLSRARPGCAERSSRRGQFLDHCGVTTARSCFVLDRNFDLN